MIEVIAIIVAVVALATARGLKRQLEDIQRRAISSQDAIQELQLELTRLRRAGPQTEATPEPEPSGPAPEATSNVDASDRFASEIPDESEMEPANGRAAPADGSVPAVPAAESGAPWTSMPGGGPPTPATVPQEAPRSIEELLGTRWTVWVGGLALGLGGLLLVRYSIEQGWFGPGARIVMGLLFSFALLVAGEWFRRGERQLRIEGIPSADIPGVLTAAGTSSLFGTIYAAHALYGFIGTGAAFVLLGVVAIGTMVAAALHGPWLAGLGLAAAYVVPMLVTSQQPNPWALVIYLAIVAAAAMGLARLRRWLWLAATAIGGAVIWGVMLAERIGTTFPDWTIAGYTHVLVQLLLASAFLAIEPNLGSRDEDATPEPVATASLGALSFVAVIMLAAGRYELASSVPFMLATAFVLIVVAWRAAPAAVAACWAGIVVLAGISTWPGLKTPPPSSLMAPELAPLFRLPENITTFLAVAAFASTGIMAAALNRLLIGPRLRPSISALYALAATATPLLALIITWLRVKQFDSSIPFALMGLALSLILAVAAGWLQRQESADWPGSVLATGAVAAGSIAAFSYALVVYLDRGYLTVALALTALGTAWIAADRNIPLLRHMVTALAFLVLGRIAWDPRIMGDSVGRWPILNWLLIGYGVSAAAFYGAARLMERRGADFAKQMADGVAVLLAGLLAFFQIHHALNGGDVFAPTSSHVEAGLLTLVALGFSNVLMRMDSRRANAVFHWASIGFALLSGLFIAIGLGVLENPLLKHNEFVRGPVIFSSLLLAYLLPGVAALLLMRASRGRRPPWMVTGLGILAILLVFAYVTLEVRHAFHGPVINLSRRVLDAEQWAYSAAWLGLGILLLFYGLWRQSIEARLASAALVVLAVLKVFLVDMSELTGLWRALSFIVLGLVLIGIGTVYQNLVFGRGRPPATPGSAAGGGGAAPA